MVLILWQYDLPQISCEVTVTSSAGTALVMPSGEGDRIQVLVNIVAISSFIYF